jgi:membrane protein
MKKTARRLVAVTTAAVARYFRCGAPDFAAGIAYRVLFALAPLVVALVSVFGLFLQNDEFKTEVINKIVSVLPVKSHDVTKAIENIARPASAAGLISLLVLVWAASGMMTAIRFGLDRTMSVEEDRGVVHGKLIDLGLVVAMVALVLASVGIGLITEVVNSLVGHATAAVGLHGSVAKAVISKLLPVLLWSGTVLLLYHVVPAKRPPLHDALAGAVLTAVLLLVISLAAGFLYSHATKWSIIYGSLTSVFVFLYSVYLFASAVLLGAAFATEWSRPHPPAGESLLVRTRRWIRARLPSRGRSQSDESSRGTPR